MGRRRAGSKQRAAAALVCDDSAQALARVQCVNRLQRALDSLEAVRDVVVELEVASLVVVDERRHLGAALEAAKGGAHPLSACHQLEGAGADLLARRRDADHARLAPPAVGRLERGAHHVGVARRVERVVDPPLRHLDENLLDRLVVVLRVDAVRGAQLNRHAELVRVRVDGEDALGAAHLCPLDHREADGAEAKDSDACAALNVARVPHGAQARRDAAAEERARVERRGVRHLGARDVRHDCVLREGRAPHEVLDFFAVGAGEAGGAVGHHAGALS
mmetsp:Transcript_14651/g.47054  ORF Transcript_14651/g.47054 Transcript_14651/m.47054 type:complete len:277 (-) Transcript_14651:274-1104(-)